MEIRKATAADLAAVAEIYADTHTEIEAGRLTVGWIRSIYPGIHTAEAALERDDLFVAEEEGQIVGVILAGHDGRRGHISHTAVDSAFRRRGIGGQLVEHTMAALEQEGITKVNLVVFSRNETGNAFWESMGFTVRTDLTYRDRRICESVRMDT